MENKKFKILAIDDNMDNLITLKALINEVFSQAVVLTALSGQAGLEIAEKEDPDIILLDIIMPIMDGFEVCTQLKQNRKLREIPVVFITALKGDKENRIRALECGAEAFLTKPIDEADLIAQILAMLKIKASNIQKRDEKKVLAEQVEEKTKELKEANIQTLELLETIKKEQALIEAIFDSIPGYLYVYDENSKLIKWNKKHETLTGYSSEELSQMTLDKWFSQEDIPRVKAAVDSIFKKGYGEVEAELILKNKEKMLTRSSGVPLMLDGRMYFAGIGVDITEQKQTQDALIESQRIAHLGTWKLIVATNEVIWSDEIYKMFGYDSTQNAPPYTEHMKLFTPDSWTNLSDSINQASSQGIPFNLELETINAGKENGWIWIRGDAKRDPNGNIAFLWGVAQDISEHKKIENKLRYLSYHDHLTGLYNRRYFEDILTKLDTLKNLPLSIIMCDINGLKMVNDSFGHNSGDLLLINAAETLKGICRKNDVIARIGGDEFVILLPNTPSSEAFQIANHIKNLASKCLIENIELSISYGYETKLYAKQSIFEILSTAENHMYRQKIYERSSIRSKTIDLIMNTLFEKSNREAKHSFRVSKICQMIATKMDLDRDSIEQMRIAGLIHDIGKIGVDEKILNKPAKLTEDERGDINRHTEIGWRLLSSTNEFSELAQFVLNHHEKWDGSGYPNGVKGESIPLESRIISVADAFDAMTSDRSYKKGISIKEAIQELISCSGTHFDPNIVDVFVNKILLDGEKFEYGETKKTIKFMLSDE